MFTSNLVFSFCLRFWNFPEPEFLKTIVRNYFFFLDFSLKFRQKFGNFYFFFVFFSAKNLFKILLFFFLFGFCFCIYRFKALTLLLLLSMPLFLLCFIFVFSSFAFSLFSVVVSLFSFCSFFALQSFWSSAFSSLCFFLFCLLAHFLCFNLFFCFAFLLAFAFSFFLLFLFVFEFAFCFYCFVVGTKFFTHKTRKNLKFFFFTEKNYKNFLKIVFVLFFFCKFAFVAVCFLLGYFQVQILTNFGYFRILVLISVFGGFLTDLLIDWLTLLCFSLFSFLL